MGQSHLRYSAPSRAGLLDNMFVLDPKTNKTTSTNTKLSHLRMTKRCIELPCDEQDTLKWWRFTDGDFSYGFDPSKYPEQPAIPAFWKRKNTVKGGTVYSYVGHFRCIRFDKTLQGVTFQGQLCKALLEFEFVRFDTELASKMGCTRDKNKKSRQRRRKNPESGNEGGGNAKPKTGQQVS